MIGINPASWNDLARGKSFVSRYSLTFTNLWDDTSRVHQRYGRPYNSNYWLLDKYGNRVGDRAVSFSKAGVEQKLDSLE